METQPEIGGMSPERKAIKEEVKRLASHVVLEAIQGHDDSGYIISQGSEALLDNRFPYGEVRGYVEGKDRPTEVFKGVMGADYDRTTVSFVDIDASELKRGGRFSEVLGKENIPVGSYSVMTIVYGGDHIDRSNRRGAHINVFVLPKTDQEIALDLLMEEPEAVYDFLYERTKGKIKGYEDKNRGWDGNVHILPGEKLDIFTGGLIGKDFKWLRLETGDLPFPLHYEPFKKIEDENKFGMGANKDDEEDIFSLNNLRVEIGDDEDEIRYRGPKKKRVEKVKDTGKLSSEAEVAAAFAKLNLNKQENVVVEEEMPPVEDKTKDTVEQDNGNLEKEREEKINYLATRLVDDLKIFYDRKNINKEEAEERLKSFGIKTVYAIPDEGGRLKIDYEFGKDLVSKTEEFFLKETAFPSSWSVLFSPVLRSVVGLEKVDLEEARKRRIESGLTKKTVEREKAEPKSEAEKREEKLSYLATNLVDDLKIFYGPKGIGKGLVRMRLEKFGIKLVRERDGKIDFAMGKLFTNKLGEFLAMESGSPQGWKMFEGGLATVGLDITELQEVRRRKKQETSKDELDPLTRLGEIADKQEWQRLTETMANLKSGLERQNYELILKAAIDCMEDEQKQRASQGRWERVYKPLLIGLKVKM